MVCPKCGSENVNVQAVAEQKGRGCLSVLMWCLLAFCTFGIILLIVPALTKKKAKRETTLYAKVVVIGGKFKQKKRLLPLYFLSTPSRASTVSS